MNPSPKREPSLTGSQAILAVADITATLAYYHNILGFPETWTWGDPPGFGGALWGSVHVMFHLQPELAKVVGGHEHFFRVAGVDALHARQAERGATVLSPPEDRPWGMREYVVRDLNGYHLRFAEPRTGAVPGRAVDGALPEGFRLVERKPTPEKHLHLAHAVGWSAFVKAETLPRALEHAGFGVVIVDEPDGRVVGAGLVIDDRVSAFYLKDVMVHPDVQRRGLGTAIVGALIAYIERTASPRGLATLFTGRGLAGFYGRYGFAGPDEGLYGMSRWVKRKDS